MRCLCYFFFSMNRRRPRSTLFPYTTLFRSLKGRVGGRLRGEKAQEVPLRHQRDELAAGREVTEVRERQRAIADLRAELRRSEEHTSELQSPDHLVCRLLLEKKKGWGCW